MSVARTERLAARAPQRAATEAVAVPALRLVDRSALPRRRALTRAATMLASTLAAVGLFGVVCLHVLLTQGQADLDALHARADAATAANGKLTVEVAQLQAPARVVDWARSHLGMVPLDAVVYLQAVDPAAPLPPVPEGPLLTPEATAPTAASTDDSSATDDRSATGDSVTSDDSSTAGRAATATPTTAKSFPTTLATRKP